MTRSELPPPHSTSVPSEAEFARSLTHALHSARRQQTETGLYVVRLLGDAPASMQELGQRLQGLLRQSDLYSAIDDGFIIMAENLPGEQAAAWIADKLCRQYDEHQWAPGQQIQSAARTAEKNIDRSNAAIAVGISIYPRHGRSAQELTDAAHDAAQAAYLSVQARPETASDFRIYHTTAQEASRLRLASERLLPDALRDEEFSLRYQPQIRLADRQLCGFEALLRWHNPRLGIVAPDMFFPVLESSGAAGRVGRWVINECATELARWQSGRRDALRISINASGRQFRNESIVADFKAMLVRTGLPPECFEVELTERVFVSEISEHRQVFHDLKELGVSIALDDFGIGYSSLAYLKNFPVDAIKIDRSFIADMATHPTAAGIVRGIISLAHNLSMRAVAEGIEDETQLDLLSRWECDEAQGYAISRPLDASQAAALR